MKIPKVFGNKIILVVLALALFLVVIISLVNIDNLAFTGFAGSNKGDNEPVQNKEIITENDLSILENINKNGLPYEHLIILEEQETSAKTQPFRGKSSHKGGSGSSGSSNSGGSNSNTENTEDNSDTPSQSTPSMKKKLYKKPYNLDLMRGGIEIKEGDEFEGIIRLLLEKSNKKISAFNINFSRDIDLSDIIADSDFISGKAFMHSSSGLLENIDLYVPVIEGIDAIIICSNASNYDEIYYGCSNNSHITKEELLYITDPRIELSLDGFYYIIHGITGTGAMGVNVTNISSGRQNETYPGEMDAFAGNITNIAIPQGLTITQSWQGFFGNVSGTIMLGDASDNVMYNWSLASPEGEVLASTNSSVLWSHIQCFNFTASGTYQDESGNGGSTNLYGTNLTQLEAQYGIEPNDLDGVDETFLLQGAGTHNTFYINSNEFEEGECYNTRIIDSSGFGQDDHFEEVILYEPVTSSVVFCAILNENIPGFDDKPHDFEILVLEDGHDTDTSTTTYYFYAVMF